MGNEEIKLPDSKQVEFLSSAFYRKEWVMDPPSFIWWRLKEDILVNVLQTKMKYLAKLSKLEAQAKEIEGQMFEEIAQSMGR
jgi:hypothetical protein